MNNKKYLYINIIVITFTVILYMIELLMSKPMFNINKFSLNYAISFPFILMSVIANCGIAEIMNKPIFLNLNIFIRTIIGGISVVLVAGVLVLVGNLPFIPDIVEYVRTTSFYKSVAAATLINIFILTVVNILRQVIINRNLQKENAILQYQQLKNQINPHFLFNSLNVLVSLINKNQDTAVKYTKKLSAIYRYVLTQDLQDTVKVKEEMEFIDNYIGILKTRFNEGLKFKFDIRQADMSKSIPPMSLQLLIENAVKHNAVFPESPLVISIITDGNYLSVSNNIKPRMSHNEGTGVGLKNLSKKYAILAKLNISIIKETDTFTVKLPLL